MRNAIVTATDARYLPAACCALLSCVRDGGAGSREKLFLLVFDVSATDIANANAFLGSHGASAEIIPLGSDHFRQFRIDGYVSASTYSRLLLGDFFDDRWDRILYVDADMRVMERLQTLFDANLGGRPLGAVHDYVQYMLYGVGGSRDRLSLRSDSPYFNAGLICFDWRVTTSSGLLQRAKEFAIENPHLCKAHDQDALNKAFEGAWAPLDPRWNLMTIAIPEKVLRLDYPARFLPYISHFAGPIKPWMASFSARYETHRTWYRELLRESPWPHFVVPAAVASGELAVSYADRLTEWLSLRRKTLRAALASVSPSPPVSRLPPIAITRKSSPTYASKDPGANPQLERLFDDMVDEAAAFETAVAQ